MIRSLILILFLSVLIYAEQGDSSVVRTEVPVLPDSILYEAPLLDTVSLEVEKERTFDYRYQVVSGVAMMLFFGLAIGASQSLNPN